MKLSGNWPPISVSLVTTKCELMVIFTAITGQNHWLSAINNSPVFSFFFLYFISWYFVSLFLVFVSWLEKVVLEQITTDKSYIWKVPLVRLSSTWFSFDVLFNCFPHHIHTLYYTSSPNRAFQKYKLSQLVELCRKLFSGLWLSSWHDAWSAAS